MAEEQQQEKVYSLEDIETGNATEFAKVPGFKAGEIFVIGTLSSADLIEWSEVVDPEKKRVAGLRLVVKSLVDGIPGVHTRKDGTPCTGERIIPETEEDKYVQVFLKKDHKTGERIARAVLSLNGMLVKQENEVKKD